MATYSWRSAKIQQDLALLEKSILLVQLDQLEGSSGSVPFLLGKLVPFVETTLSVLLLDRHGRKRLAARPKCKMVECVAEGRAIGRSTIVSPKLLFPVRSQEFLAPIR